MQFPAAMDHAIRILHYLHVHKDFATAQDISVANGISYQNFSKISIKLREKDLIASMQGRNGGYFLAKPANKISFYDVFLALEGDIAIHHSLADKDCTQHAPSHCAFRSYFENIQKLLIDELSSQSVADFAPLLQKESA